MLQWLFLGLATYAIGAVPSAYLVCRLLRGRDIRRWGDGNAGAANVYRQVGPRAGTAVAIVDIGKGVLAVLVARQLVGPGAPELWGGVLAVMGHNWPLFLRFQGGRGAATALGVLLVLLPLATIPLALVGLGVLFFSRSATVALAVFFIPLAVVSWYTHASGVLIGYAVALPVLVGLSHYLSGSRTPAVGQGRPPDVTAPTT